MASFVIGGDTSGQVTFQAPSVAGSTTLTLPASTGTVITSATTGNALPGQINWNTTPQKSGFTAVAYGGYFCNTTSAAFTVTLPSSPTRGQFVVVVDYAGTSATNNITVDPNGSKIKGVGSGATLSTNRQGITFTYIDSTQGWLASSNVYGGSTPFTQTYAASYLVVAGGGGGGGTPAQNAWGGSGGGAGGMLTGSATLSAGSTYTITVGALGAGGTVAVGFGSSGNNSVLSGSGISTITATGGGGGGCTNSPNNGLSGGSGGGGSGSGLKGSGTPGQGNNGADGYYAQGGGGGGAGGVGQQGAGGTPAYRPGGPGGLSLASSITGSSVDYAGGGGGGCYAGGASGGPGGGAGAGAGANDNNTGTQGGDASIANRGSGGGGSTSYSTGSTTGKRGGNGSDGIVIISVPTSKYPGTTTGSPTVTTSGGNTILQYTASGTYTA